MSNDNFKWTEDLAIKFARYYKIEMVKPENWGKDILPKFKSSHSSTKEEVGWEIVSFRGQHGKIWEKDLFGNYGYLDEENFIPYQSSLSWMLQSLNNGFTIHSVRRKSDSVVFSVGDRLDKYDADIKEFYIEGCKLKIISDAKGKGCVTDRLLWELENLSKLPQPLPIRNNSFFREMKHLEERIAYIEKKLNIEG